MRKRRRGGAAFGPLPGLVLSDQEAEDIVLAKAADTGAGLVSGRQDRKQKAWERFLVFTEDYEELIHRRIWGIQKDQTVRNEMSKFVDLSMNLALDITNSVSVVWKHGARRTIEGASESEQEAFFRLVEDTGFSMRARAWNRQAFYQGPITVVPVIRQDRLSWDTLLPYFYDVVRDESDPWGNPAAVCWSVGDPTDPLRRRDTSLAPDANIVLLDGDSWRYFGARKTNGKDLDLAMVEQINHDMGMFPGTTLRLDETHGTSWWGCDRHQRLQDATIMIGVIQAALSYVRKAQNRKLLKVLGDLRGLPRQQQVAGEPEIPLVAQANSPEQIAIDAIDFDTNPENFMKHATWIMQMVARSYGGELALGSHPSTTGGVLGADIKFGHEALTELRNDQIPFARQFERDLWGKSVEMAKRQNMPGSEDLPDPDLIREGLNIEFPRLSPSFANTKDEIEWFNWCLAKGKLSYGDLLVTEMPSATDDERDAEIIRRVERQIPVLDMITKRNLSLAPEANTDLETPSQMNGSMGPEVRDSNERQDDGSGGSE